MNSQQRLSFIDSHVEIGVSAVDHAYICGDPACESLFGEALKLAHYNSSKKDTAASVETSLKRSGTDYLDILLIHRPDFLMDADEVAGAFQAVKQAGKVNHFGVSNFNAAQMSLLQSRLDAPLVPNQIELNPVNIQVAESGLLEYLQEHRIRPMAWSCLAGGCLMIPRWQCTNCVIRCIYLRMSLVQALIGQVIYAWIMRMPSQPLPVLGSGNAQRAQEAVAALSLSMCREHGIGCCRRRADATWIETSDTAINDANI
jgi:predicted oxidoreductase